MTGFDLRNHLLQDIVVVLQSFNTKEGFQCSRTSGSVVVR